MGWRSGCAGQLVHTNQQADALGLFGRTAKGTVLRFSGMVPIHSLLPCSQHCQSIIIAEFHVDRFVPSEDLLCRTAKCFDPGMPTKISMVALFVKGVVALWLR